MAESYTLDVYNSGRTVVGDAITELAKDAREYFTQRARNAIF